MNIEVHWGRGRNQLAAPCSSVARGLFSLCCCQLAAIGQVRKTCESCFGPLKPDVSQISIKSDCAFALLCSCCYGGGAKIIEPMMVRFEFTRRTQAARTIRLEPDDGRQWSSDRGGKLVWLQWSAARSPAGHHRAGAKLDMRLARSMKSIQAGRRTDRQTDRQTEVRTTKQQQQAIITETARQGV